MAKSNANKDEAKARRAAPAQEADTPAHGAAQLVDGVEDTDKLIPYALNSRTHSDQQIDKIAASIKEFGFVNPVIVWKDNVIIAGHCRVLAAKKLGIKKIPVRRALHMSDAMRKAYVIMDNRSAMDSGWDRELLRGELSSLQDIGIDLALTGFEPAEIESLMGGGASEEESEEKEPGQFEPITFVLHNTQATMVKEAIEKSKALGGAADSINENAEANALAYICRQWLKKQ